jgi:hypothetical protein
MMTTTEFTERTGTPVIWCPLTVGEHRPEVVRQLEELDDTIFAAINGNADALDRAATTWKTAVERLGPEPLAESRRQYLRFATCVWENLHRRVNQPLHKTYAAREVIDLLGGSLR